jgi:hypothetical protein
MRNVTVGFGSPDSAARRASSPSASSRDAIASVYAASVAIFPLYYAVSDIATNTRTIASDPSKRVQNDEGDGFPLNPRFRCSASYMCSSRSGR